ncbi:MAG: hypothetical protein R3B48_29775 [Kofleriaceae bacterium]
MVDAPPPPDSPPVGCQAWTPYDSAVDPCAAALGTPVNLALLVDSTFNTETGELTVGGLPGALPGLVEARGDEPSVRIVNLASLSVVASAKLTLTGAHAVLFLVHGDVALDGGIEASGANGGATRTPVPGADAARCTATTAPGAGQRGNAAVLSSQGGGGGGGGGNSEDGGDGSAGGGGVSGGGKGVAAAGGVVLRGGCAGGSGGDGNSAPGGQPGGGGGAVAISAKGAITLSGRIAVNGGAGQGGTPSRGGGGGGGSGGQVLLDGEQVTLQSTAELCAKGGGGGEGAGMSSTGASGAALICGTAVASPGGAGGSRTGGDGGAGGTGAGAQRMGGPGVGGSGGGGGGGGAAGRILVRSRAAAVVNQGRSVAPELETLP